MRKNKMEILVKKDYVVEVTRYEFWNLSRRMKRTGIEFPLNDERSPRVSYGVNVSKLSITFLFFIN
jgi:hypothetical protein